MQIAEKKVVKVHYTLKEENEAGNQVESTVGREPLAYIHGIGMMLPEFEKNLNDKKAGDSLSFGIKANEGYGAVNPEAVVDLPKNIFEQDGKIPEGLLEIGNVLPMKNDQGHQLNGIVRWVGLDSVKVDFNHPMAGIDLWFEVTVEEVRDAEQVELDHGHVHDQAGTSTKK